MKRKKYITIAILIAAALVLPWVGWLGWNIYETYPNPPAIFIYEVAPMRHYDVTATGNVANMAKTFDDKQPVQIKAATAMGINPVVEHQIEKEVNDGKLVRLHDTNLYYLHAVDLPYLTPEAADLLAQIGAMYQQQLHNSYQRLRVTSCLRTAASVAKLQKVNPNSVKNSCHLYGTTFDISYALMNTAQKNALGRVLRSLQQAGYCYVKYELRQPCFHITVRK